MPDSLNDWLGYIERLHSRPIDLGLERVLHVKHDMGMCQKVPLITVGGTNGKGSTCAIVESILLCAGYRVGLYTSPHLIRYNERVRIDGRAVGDKELCGAFAAVDAARGDLPLTYFEFGTLAAWHIFSDHELDALILEVGLGGRLDAVNAFDADCAVLSSIGIDHMDYLGDTRERIGTEKAGIFRRGRPAVIGDPDPPSSVLDHGLRIGAHCRLFGQDFGYSAERTQWLYWSKRDAQVLRRRALAHPVLRGANQLLNASTAIAALESVSDSVPVSMQDIRRGLLQVELPGRFQVLPGRPVVVLDVAHNAHAAAVLAANLDEMGFFTETWAVFGMLHDKDIAGVVERLRAKIDRWLVCSLDAPRGESAEAVATILRRAGVATDAVASFGSAAEAYARAQEVCGEGARIVVFGSFLTVADVMRTIEGVPG